jgi:hypothetical protein
MAYQRQEQVPQSEYSGGETADSPTQLLASPGRKHALWRSTTNGDGNGSRRRDRKALDSEVSASASAN